MATLLTNPALMKNDFMAYQIFHEQAKIIAIVKKEQEEQEKELDALDVGDMLDDIDKNARSINTLLKDKYNIFGRLLAIMNLKAYTKTVMSEYQITAFQEFNTYYEQESEKVNQKLQAIEERQIEIAKKEILKRDSDYSSVYKELKTLNDYQYDAIFDLNNIVEQGNRTLAII